MFKSTWIALALIVAATVVAGVARKPGESVVDPLEADGIDGSGYQEEKDGIDIDPLSTARISVEPQGRGNASEEHNSNRDRKPEDSQDNGQLVRLYSDTELVVSNYSRFDASATLQGAHSTSVMNSEDKNGRSAELLDITATDVARQIMFSVNALDNESAPVDTIAMYGPIQGVAGSTFNIMGQDFNMSTLDLNEGDLVALIGRSAYVEGSLTETGFQAAKLEVFEEYSIPGASPVLLSGLVNDVSSDVGLVRIANLDIDVTRLDAELEIGSQLAIAGIQPMPEGLILGQNRLGPDELSRIVGIDGSSGRGIDGSSGRGIDGSSGRGIDGSSGRGIDGSSGRGIDGSSGRGIDGSSGRGIDGSSGRGIDGSSGRGIDGSSGRGIDGSSGRGIDGSSGR